METLIRIAYQNAERTRPLIAESYGRMLVEQFGIDKSSAELIVDRLVSLRATRAFAISMVSSFDSDNFQMDQILRSHLGERYVELVEWEKGDSARREYRALVDLANAGGVAIGDFDRDAILAEIGRLEAYSTRTMREMAPGGGDGGGWATANPRSEIPRSWNGTLEMLTERYTNLRRNLAAQTPELLARLEAAGVSVSAREAVAQHYAEVDAYYRGRLQNTSPEALQAREESTKVRSAVARAKRGLPPLP